MMLKSAKDSFDMGIDSVKFHPLYVVKNTILANEYQRGEFKPISMDDYLRHLLRLLR